MKYKFKMFSEPDLENKINHWLSENESIIVTNLQFSADEDRGELVLLYKEWPKLSSETLENIKHKIEEFNKPLVNHTDYPIEDTFGLEIISGDTYFMFGRDVVHEQNLKQYLIENHEVPCYKAAD